MLQGVPVLQQELVHTGLRLQPRCCLCRQLVLQQVNLKQEAEKRGVEKRRAEKTRCECKLGALTRTKHDLHIQP